MAENRWAGLLRVKKPLLLRGFLTPYFYVFFGPTIVDTWMHLAANGSKLGDFTLFRGLMNQPTG